MFREITWFLVKMPATAIWCAVILSHTLYLSLVVVCYVILTVYYGGLAFRHYCPVSIPATGSVPVPVIVLMSNTSDMYLLHAAAAPFCRNELAFYVRVIY